MEACSLFMIGCINNKKQGFKGHIHIERDAEDQPSNLPSVIQTVKYYNEQINKLN